MEGAPLTIKIAGNKELYAKQEALAKHASCDRNGSVETKGAIFLVGPMLLKYCWRSHDTLSLCVIQVYDKISALLQKKEKELADSKELRAKQEALANNADTTNDTEEKSNEGDDSDDSDIDLYEAAAEGSDSDADEGSYATYDAADDI